MLSGIQIIGLLFGLFMLYLSRLYYRRGEFKQFDFVFWCMIWVAYLYAILFPSTLNVMLETLGIMGAMHLLTIFGFMVSFGLLFYLFKITRKLQNKMEKLVTEVAQHGVKK